MATPTENTVHFLHEIPGQHIYKGVAHLPVTSVKVLDSLPEFEFSPEDILVATYPKAGTTWMCEVADVVHHDGDMKMAARAPIVKRWQFVELDFPGQRNMEILKAAKPPRQIKTHIHASFLSKQIHEQGVRTLVVFRNHKDMLVSYYHFYRMNAAYNHFQGTWDDFFEIFKAQQLMYGDPIDHMLGWWALRDLPNVEVFMYEDMLRDSVEAVKRVAQFLGKQFTDAQIEDIVNYCSFNNMKKNPAANYSWSPTMAHSISAFLRKGKAGDWKNYFSQEQNRYVDELIENKLAGTGLTFTFE